jgi:glycosyltransferase involved in cell wall biosynthesis
MKSGVVTTIPVYNSEAFLLQTLESLAAQRLKPDRVVVIDDGSTDGTEALVKGFKGVQCEWLRNPATLGLFGNFNRCLDFASEADYVHILHADDVVTPEFYEVMTRVRADCKGFGMAWCLDERIDENNRRLSVSGKEDGQVEVLDRDEFLKRKAEIGNQAFAATLLKTSRQPVPCRFPTDMPILGDMVYWAQFGEKCEKVVHVHRALAKYRWHGSNATCCLAPSINALILDEWKTMQLNEALRARPTGLVRNWKLRGLLAVRAGIKAKRYRQLKNHAYSKEIVGAARPITGLPLWIAGKFLVELRDMIVYTILRRPRHPKNMFS